MHPEIRKRRTAWATAFQKWNKDEGFDVAHTINLGEDLYMAAVALDAEVSGELVAAFQLLRGVAETKGVDKALPAPLVEQIRAFIRRHQGDTDWLTRTAPGAYGQDEAHQREFPSTEA